MWNKAVNFLAYQLTWVASVLGAASSQEWLGPAVAALALACHLLLVEEPVEELKGIIVAGLAGYVVDSGLVVAGVFEFRGGELASHRLAPLWLLGLWLVFATTFRWSLSWLGNHLSLAALLGAFVGPLSYYAGDRLGALQIFPPLTSHLFVLALVWSLLLPMLFVAATYQRRSWQE